PPLSRGESLETTRIYSALGLLPEGVALLDERPVRTPHHSATAQALVGGGRIPPLEGGEVTVARVHGSVKFPAKFMLVAAMNPTASGYAAGDAGRRDKYMAK